MKNLIIFTGIKKGFDHEASILVKIQIDNSLDLGWSPKDILLVTDFPYSYNGIKSQVVPGGLYYSFDNTSNKIPVIIYLLENNLLDQNITYWYHDMDVYQAEVIEQRDLELPGFDLGIVPYGYKPQWNLGSMFFKRSSLDLFKLIDEDILTKRKSNNRCDEKAIKRLITRHSIPSHRSKDLNVTYNFTKRCIETNFRNAQKPIRILHFHPWDKDAMMSDTALNLFMYGKNRLKMPLMPQRLIDIFKKHGIK